MSALRKFSPCIATNKHFFFVVINIFFYSHIALAFLYQSKHNFSCHTRGAFFCEKQIASTKELLPPSLLCSSWGVHPVASSVMCALRCMVIFSAVHFLPYKVLSRLCRGLAYVTEGCVHCLQVKKIVLFS